MRTNPFLPVSDPPLAGENDSDGKGVDDRLFKGSAMTKRGAYAALSYMACAGNFLDFIWCFLGFDSLDSVVQFRISPDIIQPYRDEDLGLVCFVDFHLFRVSSSYMCTSVLIRMLSTSI